jgi:type VI secretion system protein VasD
MQASSRLNPNDDGRPLTTEVRLLQLRAVGRLENAGFDDIWQQGKEILAEDLVQMDDKFIDPAASLVFGLRRDARANYVAVVARFRKPTANDWRTIARLPLPPPDKCTPQPAEVMQAPSREDTQLKFFLELYRVENRTPPERAFISILGDRGGRA